jgi:hypothetical protein
VGKNQCAFLTWILIHDVRLSTTTPERAKWSSELVLRRSGFYSPNILSKWQIYLISDQKL